MLRPKLVRSKEEDGGAEKALCLVASCSYWNLLLPLSGRKYLWTSYDGWKPEIVAAYDPRGIGAHRGKHGAEQASSCFYQV
jgi:hypothetical protein